MDYEQSLHPASIAAANANCEHGRIRPMAVPVGSSPSDGGARHRPLRNGASSVLGNQPADELGSIDVADRARLPGSDLASCAQQALAAA